MKNIRFALLSRFLLLTLVLLMPNFAGAKNFLDKPVSCCFTSDHDACSKERENALQKGCLSLEDFQEAVRKDIAVSCWQNKVAGACSCGCFSPETEILVRDISTKEYDLVAVQDLVGNEKQYQLITLLHFEDERLSPFGQVDFEINRGKARSFLNLYFANGARIRVTPDHPFFLPSGEMVMARALQEGQPVLSSSGDPILLTVIAEEFTAQEEDVISILMDMTKEEHTHLVISRGGLLTGDAAWQNTLTIREL